MESLVYGLKFLFLFFILAVSLSSACLLPNERFDCHPDTGVNQERCESRGCCWDTSDSSSPPCSYPANYGGYRTLNITESSNGIISFWERSFPSPYPDDVQVIKAEAVYLSEDILRVKISDANKVRYEPPYPKIQLTSSVADPGYKVTFSMNETGFKVQRENGNSIFNSLNIGAFTFANQFLEVSTLLANSANLYGIGEHRTSLKINLTRQHFTLFNHDVIPSENNNLYGSHPFVIATDDSGLSYGIFLHNSNAMEILVSPQPALTFRTIGGILDFYFFFGPTPEDVVMQYTSVVGRSMLPPYWGLGFHLCRFGYGSANNTRDVWERNQRIGIPYDAQWNDIDYMENYNDFTINPDGFKELPELVDDMHKAGMYYVPIVDPGISGSEPNGTYLPYDLALEMDVLVKNKSGLPLVGKLWNPVSTVYPDYTHPNIQQYWNALMNDFHDKVAFDGIWLDANEISQTVAGSVDGCPADNLEQPPYTPPVFGGSLSFGTMCVNSVIAAGAQYDAHNIYSIAQTHATNEALRNLGKRPFIITRSTFSGSGKYAGHWSGDVASSWADLKKSVQELLTFNMYGVSLMGTDICGFRDDTTQELCNRWHQLGSFYTFMRNHNGVFLADQDPAAFDARTQASIKKALYNRYFLLPYLYTLFYKSHVFGNTVARPLFFEFPEDPKAYDVAYSFFWGSALYVVPVLDEGATSVEAYLPAGLWYDFYTAGEINSTGDIIVLDAPYETIPLLIKGGSIVPTQAGSATTTESRKNDMSLIVTLNLEGTAEGSLYWDDGLSIDPVENEAYLYIEYNLFANGTLNGRVRHTTELDFVPLLQSITIAGVHSDVLNVQVDGQDVLYGVFGNVLGVTELNIPINSSFTLIWT